MKYYVFEAAEGDAKIAGKGVYEYTSKTDAVAAFHKKLGTAMGSELFTSDLIVVLGENGEYIANEKYVAGAEE